MVEISGMVGMLILAFFAIVAIYIILRFLGRPGHDEAEEDEEGEDEAEPETPRVERPAKMSDEEFIDSYTGPMLEDARGSLDMAAESAKSGLFYYGRGAWEEASGEFHAAALGVDGAMARLREVAGMVEDQNSKPVREAKALAEYCLRLRTMAIRMEEASDAMAEGKAEEAQKLAAAKKDLEQMLSGYEELKSYR